MGRELRKLSGDTICNNNYLFLPLMPHARDMTSILDALSRRGASSVEAVISRRLSLASRQPI
jgi:hypothetical protein